MKKENNQSDVFHSKIFIKLKILEIFPLKEDITNIIPDCSLKFEETNQNKYNIYNFLYALNNPIILIPTKLQNIGQINIYLIKDKNEIISKGILYINENEEQYTVEFNKYINIKFQYSLNTVNLNAQNKLKKKEVDPKSNIISDSKNKRNIKDCKKKFIYKFSNNCKTIDSIYDSFT